LRQAKLSRTNKRRLDSLNDGVASIVALAAQIDKNRLEGLLHRDTPVGPDGFPQSSLGDKGSPGGHSTPTEGAMMARNRDVRTCFTCVNADSEGSLEERIRRHSTPVTENTVSYQACPSCGAVTKLQIIKREVPDELRETVRGIERNVQEAERLLAAVVDSLSYIAEVDEETQGRASSLPCEVCLLLPATKAGWCGGCYQGWDEDHGRPDRARYVMWKQETKNSEGLLLVPECPPPQKVLVSA
jgi:hypothetical protein